MAKNHEDHPEDHEEVQQFQLPDIPKTVRGMATDDYRELLLRLVVESLERQRKVCHTLYREEGVVAKVRSMYEWMMHKKGIESVFVKTLIAILTGLVLVVLAQALVKREH